MQTTSKNKMQTSAATKARTDYILDQHKRGFSVNEISVLLKKDGFRSVARSRIYQILKERGEK